MKGPQPTTTTGGYAAVPGSTTVPSKPRDPVAGDAPTEKEVLKLHTHADTDGDEGSLHHTLGPAKGQSSPGDHDHRGSSSIALLDGVTISGVRGGNTALASVIAALVDLGATDTTTS